MILDRGLVVPFLNRDDFTFALYEFWCWHQVVFDNGRTMVILPELFSARVTGLGDLCRVQLPLRYAYALTVHKSQGMTLDGAVIEPQQMFAPGQCYVANSRVRSK